MTSSSSAIALAPTHPEAAQHKPAAVDERHPQVERVADEKIADQRQRADAKADRDEGVADPQSGDGVDQHEIDRPERSQLARREMAEPAAEYSECDEQQECEQHAGIKGADAGSGVAESADRKRARDSCDIDRGPAITGAARRQIGHKVTGKCQPAPHDHDQAGEIVDLGLTHPANDDFDVRQRGSGLLRIDARHELRPVVATSSAMTDMAAGALTMPM